MIAHDLPINKKMNIQACVPGTFDAATYRYHQAFDATTHTTVEQFFSLSPERIAARYAHLHPFVNAADILKLLRYKAKHFFLAGTDLIHATTGNKNKKMVVIENNSCPSGQKSMPLMQGEEKEGGYLRFAQECLLPRIAETDPKDGVLVLLYDKNLQENQGHAAALANVANETVYMVEYHDKNDPEVRRSNDWLEIKDQKGTRLQVRACFRYVTQKPRNRIPIRSNTLIINPLIACMAGGRNKLVAAKAYMKFNNRVRHIGLGVQTPQTVVDVPKKDIPFRLDKFDGKAVIKVPYSNAGQGVYTIVNQHELDDFMDEKSDYDNFIVQALIGNRKRSSSSFDGKLYHVGMLPDEEKNIYIADVRMRIMNTPEGFKPLSINARRAAAPLTSRISEGTDSWSMLGTNLSKKTQDQQRTTESDRLIVVDDQNFDRLGIGMDDLIDGYIQSVLSTIAIDRLAKLLISKEGEFNLKRFKRYNNDQQLLNECCFIQEEEE